MLLSCSLFSTRWICITPPWLAAIKMFSFLLYPWVMRTKLFRRKRWGKLKVLQYPLWCSLKKVWQRSLSKNCNLIIFLIIRVSTSHFKWLLQWAYICKRSSYGISERRASRSRCLYVNLYKLNLGSIQSFKLAKLFNIDCSIQYRSIQLAQLKLINPRFVYKSWIVLTEHIT